MACANIFISYISTSGHILLWVYLETPKCELDQYNRAFILNPKNSNFTSKDQPCNPHHQIWSVQRTPQKHICEEVNSQTQFLDLISLYQKRKEKLTRGEFGFDSSLFVKTTAKRLLAWEQHYTQPKPHSAIFTSGFAQNRKNKCQNSEIQSCSPHAAPPYSAALLFCGLMLRVSGVPALVDIGLALKTTIYFFQSATGWAASELLSVSPLIIRFEGCDIQTIPLYWRNVVPKNYGLLFFLQEPQKKKASTTLLSEKVSSQH